MHHLHHFVYLIVHNIATSNVNPPPIFAPNVMSTVDKDMLVMCTNHGPFL